MEHFTPKFRRDPNEKIHSLYQGITPGNQTVTRLVRVGQDCNHLESTQEYGPGIPAGSSGRVAVLVLGGLETTLDEIEYILKAKQQKPFVSRRATGEIVAMCQLLLERRNDRVRYFKKNPSERPKRKRVRLYLPTGYRMMETTEPGLKIAMRV